LARYPVLTLIAISAFGVVAAAVPWAVGLGWLSIVVFLATILVLCGLIARWIGPSAK
jgi:hypothetical protein